MRELVVDRVKKIILRPPSGRVGRDGDPFHFGGRGALFGGRLAPHRSGLHFHFHNLTSKEKAWLVETERKKGSRLPRGKKDAL